MRNPNFMKVRHARRHLGKLWVVKVHKDITPRGMCGWTDQMETVGLWIGPYVFHHISVWHPLRDDAEILGIPRNGNPQQRQDIRMRQAFPNENLSTKSLG